ncbi:MAG: hypothetical protein AAGI30_02420 [Planctomycetota bacterium]
MSERGDTGAFDVRDRPLIHLHIPKNAGTAMSRAVKTRLALWPPSHWLHHADVLGHYRVGPTWRDRAAHIAERPARAQQRARFFEAHAGWGMHEVVPGFEDAAYFTVIREPVDRTLSVFHFLKQDGLLDPSVPLHRFLEMVEPPEPIWAIDNAQVRFLAGERGEMVEAPRFDVTERMREVAIARLDDPRMVAAMVQERMGESVDVLGRSLGLIGLAPARANVTKHRSRADELPVEQIERIRALNTHDSALHRAANEVLDRRLRAGTPHNADLGAGGFWRGVTRVAPAAAGVVRRLTRSGSSASRTGTRDREGDDRR